MSFLEEVKELTSKKDVFYASSGNPNAYKLFVRHISHAEKLGYGSCSGRNFIPSCEITVVDFEKKKIFTTTDPVPMQEIKEIS